MGLWLRTSALLGPILACVFGGATSVGAQGTLVSLTGIAGTIEITPGLCLPGDTPSCVGPWEAQARIEITSCSAAGTLEGLPVTPASKCAAEASAFMRPNLEGFTKPSCGSSYTFTSDHADAFGEPVNELTIGRASRAISASYNDTRVDGQIVLTGWLDDDDKDADPKGDHKGVFYIAVRPAGFPENGACVSEPVTLLEIQPTSYGVIFD